MPSAGGLPNETTRGRARSAPGSDAHARDATTVPPPRSPDPPDHAAASGVRGTQGVAIRRGIVVFDGARSSQPPDESHRLSVVLGGSTACASSRIGDGRWTRRRHVPGAVSFVPAGLAQRSFVEPGRIDRLEVLIPAEVVIGVSSAGGRRSWSSCFNERDAKIEAVAFELAETHGRHAPDDRVVPDALARALVMLASRRFGGAGRRRDDAWLDPRALGRVLARIESGLATALPLPLLADEAGLSPSAFLRAFRGTMGLTPGAYVLGRRVDRARLLLESGRLAARDVGLATGFSSPAHFTNAFSRRVGETPGRYRAVRGGDRP